MSSLPIVPYSHLIPEKHIRRTFSGAIIEGRQYHVRFVESWGGSNRLSRSNVKQGEVLMFSGFLIHGLAKNFNDDLTRVALEFRLFQEK